MARRRILVALVPPGEVLAVCRALRTALGDRRSERIVPHVTVIPPMNLRAEELEVYRRHVRSVMTRTEPFRVVADRFGTFLPGAPTIHLEIGDGGTGRLAGLRSELALDGVVPSDDRAYRPHLTIRSRATEEQIVAALEATSPRFLLTDANRNRAASDADTTVGPMASAASGGAHSEHPVEPPGSLLGWTVGSVQLMEQRHETGGGTIWRPLAEESFGPEVVVGRGGVELVLRAASVIDPAVFEAGLLDEHVRADSPDRPGGLLCVTAELVGSTGVPVGVAVGRVMGEGAELTAVVVVGDHRGSGIGSRLLAHWTHRANTSGVSLIWSGPRGADARCRSQEEFLGRYGYVEVGGRFVREIG